MAKTEINYSDSEIRQISSLPIGFLNRARIGSMGNNPSVGINATAGASYAVRVANDLVTGISYSSLITGVFLPHNNRVIGYILGENSDGSKRVAILGNETINLRSQKYFSNYYTTYGRVDNIDAMSPSPTYTNDVSPINGARSYIEYVYSGSSTRDVFDLSILFDYKSSILTFNSNSFIGALYHSAVYNGRSYSGDTVTLTLTNDYNSNTLQVGVPQSDILKEQKIPYSRSELFDNILVPINGDMVEFFQQRYSDLISIARAFNGSGWQSGVFSPSSDSYGYDHAFDLEYFNLILTRDLRQAKKYIDDGTIPTDATINSLDISNLPTYTNDNDDGSTSSGSDEGGDDNNENGDDSRDTETIEVIPPRTLPQTLTNNHLYWLQSGELADFITWFWTEAGNVIELGDLWNKIQGLYSDLGSAIVNIRYMPININWIGGTSDSSAIILGLIQRNGTVQKINRAIPQVRNIGRIKITEKYKSFCDYAPYSNLVLYLPYYGYVELDINIFMNYVLEVQAIYDIMSGTIQYIILCDDGNKYPVNTYVAKMAVDIPITLQSKNDRDSAVFSNVTNASAGLIASINSVASGNPIGLVMGADTLSGSHAISPPMTLKGNVSESGAFYTSPYCAIYVKRPTYNRPKLYKHLVGYPCNKNYKISSDSISGYFTVYNPQITFSLDNIPLQEEIEELYTLLTEGVYK